MLVRRVANPDLGLEAFWQGVTGGLEEGEDLEQAAMRELTEETGFVTATREQLKYSYSFPIQEEWCEMYPPKVEQIVEHVFVAFVAGLGEPTLSMEHDMWQWCTLDQALRLLTYPGNIQALERCADYLNSRSSKR
ncbi:MAG: NUDIX domain-containing protein [Deltaproteobacteria bacterium]|nr:MAG: NUDIX domain-containing protein [Deltaproteobacteria bacterium]